MQQKRPPVARNDDIILDISALGAEGEGIGRADGYAVFVPGALPGERVRAHIIKAGSGYGVAKLLEVLVPARDRVTPPCAIFDKCGGCTLQHLDYAAQLVYKRKAVEDALTRLGGLKGIAVPPVTGMDEPWQYRNKGSFPFAEIGGRVQAGFFAPRSHRLIPTEDCLIQKESGLLAMLAVRDWANAHGVLAYDEQTGKGMLRHVVARASAGGEAMVTIVAASASIPEKQALIETLRERVEGLKSVYLNIQKDRTNVILGMEYRLLWGEPYITETLCGLPFSISPASFLQVNPVQTEKLYQKAIELLALTGTERVVDAYCGIGTITLLLARHAKEVIGIENVPEAVEDARRNAEQNGIQNARFLCAPAEEALPKLLADGFQADALVLDPPRKGAEEAFLRAVTESGVKRVVYISCNPATLARDCKILSEGGYKVEAVQPFDLFPQTAHVEVCCLIEKV
ncbi:MAG TPA: 23S rRNA (uracil(1939)-C(5))-methyltransferase RlmD [Feifaniaceae bacterium]|nr:23S rRNA (uracil(1939)-C(5))-methyltransferase RlmD [Feifaniaceae bacterium]